MQEKNGGVITMMTSSSVVGVKFLLEYGHFLMVGLHSNEVERVISLWEQPKTFEERYIYSGTCQTSGARFSLDLAKVSGLHSFDMQALLEQQKQQGNPPSVPMQGRYPFFGRS